MLVDRPLVGAIVVVAILVGAAPPAAADGLRTGGAWSTPEIGGGVALRAGSATTERALGEPDLRLGFTPRGGASFLFDLGTSEDAPRLGLDLGLAPAASGFGRLDGLALLPAGRPLALGGEPEGGLAVGGALAWSDLTLGGSFSSALIGRSELDLWSARVGYGPLAARLAYGQAQAPGGSERELWLFGTDLAARNWLTLEGDVGVTTQPDREPATTGRIGLRLNF
ncbi:MAG: hypothetical protein NZ555_07200 [Geminicoccaceae bacterium]|nr:hypothetical protein [Geminicoccaceae bacterium]